MLIFMDTEFTDANHLGLISVALAGNVVREFNAEYKDFNSDTRWIAIDDRPNWFKESCPNLLVIDSEVGFIPRDQWKLRSMILEQLL